MPTRSLLALVLVGLLAAPPAFGKAYAVTEEREPCSAHSPLRVPLFGDTHVHTAYSFDAASQNTRGTPRDAYRFARGEKIGIQPYDAEGKALRSVQLERPLHWTAVTDHSEMLGEVRACMNPGEPGFDSDACWFYRTLGPLGMLFAMRVMIERNRFDFCGEGGELCRENAMSAWNDIRDAAEEAYDRSADCRFTSFVGYEWTASVGNGENLHRNVIFRNEKVPAYPTSWVETPSAHDFWLTLERDCREGLEGCEVLTIPHNSNISGDGLMFASGRLTGLQDAGLPPDAADAKLRARYEPLIEIMQHKGDSECLLGGDTVDEACGFEKVPYDSFAGVRRIASLGTIGSGEGAQQPKRSAMVREALKKGLAQEQELGVNPFKYGILASTDTHLGTPGLTTERRSLGHGGAGQNAANALPTGLPDNLEFNPGGLAVVWAEENSRDAIFAALQRKETYGTSGTRPVVRFFGGWGYDAGLCGGDEFASQGYAGGVPMGGDLSQPPQGSRAPRFAVSALRDPGTSEAPGTPLQRVQVVKGWRDSDGATHERVFDVAGGDNDATVDVDTCEARGSGANALCEVWEDPDFDADQHAFYYARVLENPTCRWSQRLCVEAGVDCSNPDKVPAGFEPCCSPDHRKVIQERAWTSPIWYSPSK